MSKVNGHVFTQGRSPYKKILYPAMLQMGEVVANGLDRDFKNIRD